MNLENCPAPLRISSTSFGSLFNNGSLVVFVVVEVVFLVVVVGFVLVVVFLGVTAAAAGFLVVVVSFVLTLDYYLFVSVFFDSVELV